MINNKCTFIKKPTLDFSVSNQVGGHQFNSALWDTRRSNAGHQASSTINVYILVQNHQRYSNIILYLFMTYVLHTYISSYLTYISIIYPRQLKHLHVIYPKQSQVCDICIQLSISVVSNILVNYLWQLVNYLWQLVNYLWQLVHEVSWKDYILVNYLEHIPCTVISLHVSSYISVIYSRQGPCTVLYHHLVIHVFWTFNYLRQSL